MQSARALCLLACVLLAVFVTRAKAYPSRSSYYWPRNEILEQLEPGDLENMIDTLNNMIMMERTSKRGLDLGLSRGYSGALQAKHLMGLAAANFAEGPGRRRRRDTQDALL